MRTPALSPKRQLVHGANALTILCKPIEVMKWCSFVKRNACPMFENREQMYRHLQEDVIRGPIDYLEFGVADGASLRQWLTLNRHDSSRFWGFDSFEGLPEDWRSTQPKGAFSRNGKPPVIDDHRLRFEIGWFQDTVPTFLKTFEPNARLVIHNDSDLYSSTLYALTQLDACAPAGTILIFDEFYDAHHEFRALMDYASAYRRVFNVIAATAYYNQAAIVLS